jgi:GTPase SAR1 family protein
MRNADGVYLVYDVTNEKSFKMLEFWYDCIKKSTNDDIVIYLLGNKSDLKNKKNYKDEKYKTVATERALDFVKEYNLQGYKAFYQSKIIICDIHHKFLK